MSGTAGRTRRRRVFRAVVAIVTVAVVGYGHALPASADPPVSTSVSAQTVLFNAGHASGPVAGTSPTAFAVSAWSEDVTFSFVTGSTTCYTGCPASGPDGGPSSVNINSLAGISGVIDATPNKNMLALMGVFLDDSEPADPAPPRLDFTNNHNFNDLSPQLRQSFFIGDGHTDGGALQTFHIPVGATRLYLGFADASNFNGTPGFYTDNAGSLSVQFALGGTRRTSTTLASSLNPSWSDAGVTYGGDGGARAEHDAHGHRGLQQRRRGDRVRGGRCVGPGIPVGDAAGR